MLAMDPCITGSASRGKIEESLPGNGLIATMFRFESMESISSGTCLEGLPTNERRGELTLLVKVLGAAPNLETLNFGVAPITGLTLPGESKLGAFIGDHGRLAGE